ncbi:MAG TPA: hypothetical protein VKT72_04955 [Candidatus Baltobacteraceae bacterium]|nr:hypothetical protein [Candidatus Baltobacteraceae bacterium]
MTKYFFAITAICASLACAGVPARAAGVRSPSAFTIKGGLLAQSSSAAGNAWFSIGADYVVHPSSTLDPINGSVYLDVLGKSVGGGIAIRNAGPVYVGAAVSAERSSAASRSRRTPPSNWGITSCRKRAESTRTA